MENRLLEIEFFFFCRNYLYYKKNKDLNSLLQFLQCLNWTNNYNCDTLCNVVIDMFVNKNNIPNLLEYLTLYDLFPKNIRKKHIREYFQISNESLRQNLTLARIKNLDKRSLRPKYPPEVHTAIKAFKKTLDTLANWTKQLNT